MNKQEQSQCYRGMQEHSYCSTLQLYFAAQLTCVNAISQYATLILGLIFYWEKIYGCTTTLAAMSYCHAESKKKPRTDKFIYY